LYGCFRYLASENLAATEFSGSFTWDEVLSRLSKQSGKAPVGLVISEVAPNMIGISTVYWSKPIYLYGLVLAFAQRVLRPTSGFLIKIFQNEGFGSYLKLAQRDFEKALMCKRSASQERFREQYLLA
jgi:23S rRNA (uridine2552-2'-O)-methyltransferase